MKVRFYSDPATGEAHIHRHAVDESEVREVLEHPLEDRPGRDGVRVALGRGTRGRFLRVIYVPDSVPGSIFVVTAHVMGPRAVWALRRRRRRKNR